MDERLGRAPRRLRLRDGAFCEVSDLDALDALLAATAHRDGWVDRMQRHLQFVLFSIVAFAALAVAAYQWGLPWAAAKGARHLPPVIGKTLSVQTLEILDGNILTAEQDSRRSGSRRSVPACMRCSCPKAALRIRSCCSAVRPQLGANAFTMPDGTIIVLDDLITSIGDDQQILAVFSHELGHAHERHGLQLLLQSSVVGAFWTLYVGDISGLLAAAPAAVVQARYSQEFERQADDYGAALLIHNRMSPALLADALKKLAESHSAGSKGGYLSSHPSTDERMRHLRELADTPAPSR